MGTAIFVGLMVLAVIILFLDMLALTLWLDRPRSEEAWLAELASYHGICRWIIARAYRASKKGKQHGRKNGVLRGEGVSPRRNASENQAHSGGRGNLPEPCDGNDSPGVLLGDSNEIRGRNLSSDGWLSSGGGRSETQGSAPAGEGDPLSGEDRRPRPSGVPDSVRSIQPTGKQRAKSDGDDGPEESFAEALERRGRELGI